MGNGKNRIRGREKERREEWKGNGRMRKGRRGGSQRRKSRRRCSYKNLARGSNTAHLTEVSRETSGTQTLEFVDFILTVTPIQTGVAGTFIDVSLTVIACIARWTDTAITINQILEEEKEGEKHAFFYISTNTGLWRFSMTVVVQLIH